MISGVYAERFVVILVVGFVIMTQGVHSTKKFLGLGGGYRISQKKSCADRFQIPTKNFLLGPELRTKNSPPPTFV